MTMLDELRSMCTELTQTLCRYQELLEDHYHPEASMAGELDRSARLLGRANRLLAVDMVRPTDEEIKKWVDEYARQSESLSLIDFANFIAKRTTDWIQDHKIDLRAIPGRWKELMHKESDDTRSPECIERWPKCVDGGYDPRCCRFPKSCSCGG